MAKQAQVGQVGSYAEKIQSMAREKMISRVVTWDSVTDRAIVNIHPDIRQAATRFINAAELEGIALRITSGFRSIAEQDKLYAQGRTTAGGIVTNAKGGSSYHNFGLAIDVVEIKDGKADWNTTQWAKIGEIGKQYGFEWGGDWAKFVDKPHFQMTFGLTTKELLRRHNAGDLINGFVRIKTTT